MQSMPVLVPQGHAIASYKWQLTQDVEPMAVTFGMSTTGANPPDTWPGDLNGIAQSSGLTNTANYGVEWTFLGSEVRFNDGSGFVTYQEPLSIIGARAGAGPVCNSAVLVQKKTGQGGRKYQGRWYLPPVHLSVSELQSNGNVNSVRLTSIQGYVTAWLANMVTALYNVELLHSDGVTSPTLVTALTVSSKAATQRRRMRP